MGMGMQGGMQGGMNVQQQGMYNQQMAMQGQGQQQMGGGGMGVTARRESLNVAYRCIGTGVGVYVPRLQPHAAERAAICKGEGAMRVRRAP